jgi:mercuric ion transport protein
MVKDTNPITKRRPSPGGALAGGGIVAGLAALIGASCCVLPIVLVQLGVSTALVAQLAVFARAKPYLLATTAGLILAGAIVAFWGGRRPPPMILALLIAGALLVVGAYSLPFYERDILAWVRGR